MKRIIALLSTICFIVNANGQIADKLVSVGFENVRVLSEGGTTYVSWEDNRYRSTYTGISSALRTILDETDTCNNIEYIVTRADIPQLHLAVRSSDVSAYKKGSIDFVELVENMIIDTSTDEPWRKLSSSKSQNSSSWKADFVIYPQLGLDNSSLDELYLYFVNLAPAMEMELWKGAKFTVQAIVPLATNMDGFYSKIRPGYITLSQEFDLKSGFKLNLTGGNFNSNRAGGILDLKWHNKNGRFSIGARAGLTVQSIVTSQKGWTFSKNWKPSGSIYADYYIPYFNTDVKAQYIRYLSGYNGARADITRHFGEYTIGLYAMYVKCDDADNNFNAGFNFSIPLPGKKYMKNRGARIRAARNWGMEYSIKAIWNREGLVDVAKNVKPSVNEGDAGMYLQPDYIRHFIIREYQKGKLL